MKLEKLKQAILAFLLIAGFIGFCVGMFFIQSYRWGHCP
jgi:uncharacterized membrane protein YwzB